jgi:predicted RNA-binding protein
VIRTWEPATVILTTMITNRFVIKVSEKDIHELLEEKHSKNTKHVVSNAQKSFKEFCKSELANLRQVTSEKLNDVLQQFWPLISTQNVTLNFYN